jgi:hypothetical protein
MTGTGHVVAATAGTASTKATSSSSGPTMVAANSRSLLQAVCQGSSGCLLPLLPACPQHTAAFWSSWGAVGSWAVASNQCGESLSYKRCNQGTWEGVPARHNTLSQPHCL